MARRTTTRRGLGRPRRKKAAAQATISAPPGRKTILNDTLAQEIADRVAGTASFKDACLLSGVSESVGLVWLRKGQELIRAGGAQVPNDEEYVQFVHLIDWAKSRCRMMLKLLIRKAAQGDGKRPGDWKAAQALGAMGSPEEFVPQVKVHIVSQFDEVIDRFHHEYRDEPLELERILRVMSGAPKAEDAPAVLPPETEVSDG